MSFCLQGLASDAQRRRPGLCELACSPHSYNSGERFIHKPLVPNGLPVASASCAYIKRKGHGVASAHRKNALAQEVGTELWGPPPLARWKYIHLT